MKFFSVLCVLCGLVVPSAALDREAFTFTKYELEVKVEPEQQRIGVRGKISLRNDSAMPQKNVVLQISSSLSWRSIQAGGKPLEFVSQPYVSDIDHTGSLSEAIVAIPQAVAPKGTLELEVGYEGTITLDATRLTRIGAPDDTAKHTDWDQISRSFTAVRGAGYVAWYPVAMDAAKLTELGGAFETLARWQTRAQGANFHVNLCEVEHGENLQTVLMNEPGVLSVPGGSSGGIGARESWACGEHDFSPVGNVVPSFVIARYEILSRDALDLYYLPEHKSAADDYALAADLAAPFVRDWFGAAQRKVTVTDLADPKAAPYEGDSFLFKALNRDADSRLAQLTIVHQLVHGAFESRRPWIDEGVAHFTQAVYREQQGGRQAALDFMSLHRGAIAEAEKAVASEKSPANDAG